MRLVLIGCVKSSELFLQKLIQMKANVVGVITKAEAGFNSDYVDLGIKCRKYGIECIYTNNINDQETKNYMRGKEADLFLCLGWSRLLDAEVLSIPKYGCIGFHPAKLPLNRGRHPLIWALALGLEETASTLFLMDATADTGKIVSQEAIIIEYKDDASSLYEKVMKVAVMQLEEVINAYESNTVVFKPNVSSEGNVWRKRGKVDGQIDWRMSSRSIYNLVRALTRPYVGAHFIHQGNEYKVWKVKELFEDGFENIEPGKVVRVTEEEHVVLKAGDNLIELIEGDYVEVKVGDYL